MMDPEVVISVVTNPEIEPVADEYAGGLVTWIYYNFRFIMTLNGEANAGLLERFLFFWQIQSGFQQFFSVNQRFRLLPQC